MHRFTLPYRVRDAQAAQDSTTFKTKAGLRQPKKDIMTICEYNHTERFELEDGGHIDGLTVRYHRSDRQYDPNGDPRKVVWICHAFTANSDPQDWWPDLVGPGKTIDPDKYFVVCVNMLGSPYGTTSPASVKPGTDRPYYFDFPKITVRDIVNANILVRKHLGVEKIDLMVGGSIGGFQALEWMIMEPDVMKRSLVSACGARVTPWVTAYNESQRMALEADPTFRECASLKGGEAGLRCARAIALISYRNYGCYNATQSEADPDKMFADKVCSYQQYQGKKLIDRFDAYSYWCLTYSLASHNVGRGRGGVEAALGRIKADTVVVGIDSDGLFPVEEQKFMATHIAGAMYVEINSRFGHDGFLIESGPLGNILQQMLDD